MNIPPKEVMINVAGKKCIVNVRGCILNDGTNQTTDEVILTPVTEIVPSSMIKAVPVHGLNAISRFATQSIIKDHGHITCTKTTQSILKPLHPPPMIPMQFKKILPKKSRKLNGQHTLLRKSVNGNTDTSATVSLMVATPSGANLSTVTHANRSVVYRKPVTTKGTAPNESNEQNIVNLTENNNSSNDNHINNLQIINDQPDITVNSAVCTSASGDLLSAAIVDKSTNPNELVIATKFQLSQPVKQQLVKQYQILNTTTGNQYYPHVKKNLQKFSEWVSNTNVIQFTHIVELPCSCFSLSHSLFVLITREIRP